MSLYIKKFSYSITELEKKRKVNTTHNEMEFNRPSIYGHFEKYTSNSPSKKIFTIGINTVCTLLRGQK